LRCGAEELYPTFQSTVVPLSLGSQVQEEEGTTALWHVRYCSPSHTKSNPRRHVSSVTSLCQLQILQMRTLSHQLPKSLP